MKIGDLVYHVDDRSDGKSIVGIVVEVLHQGYEEPIRVLFTDKAEAETWPERELKHVHTTEWPAAG